MRLGILKEFRGAADGVVDYLRGSLSENLRKLSVAFHRLTLEENFESFSATVTIPDGEELAIPNRLADGKVPTKWLIVRNWENGKDVEDGATGWNSEFVYLKNVGGDPATITAVFLI